jgi:hypothetical protein
VLDLRPRRAICGFISPQAGLDAIGSWISGENLSASHSLHLLKLASFELNHQSILTTPKRQTQRCFSKTPLSHRKNIECATSALLASKFTFGSKVLSDQCSFLPEF